MKHKVENKPYIEAMREIRKSNKAGTHADRRYRRARTRQAQMKLAMKESV
jgi:hypothetical protein